MHGLYRTRRISLCVSDIISIFHADGMAVMRNAEQTAAHTNNHMSADVLTPAWKLCVGWKSDKAPALAIKLMLPGDGGN